MSKAKQIFDNLPGIWRLMRQTTTPSGHWQNAGAECIKATGIASFIISHEDPNLIIYSEKVVIQCSNDGNKISGLEAKQKYKYRFDRNASTLTKYFSDDRLFYVLDFSQSELSNEHITTSVSDTNQLTACGQHLCIQDLYVANYIFRSNQEFIVKYSIRGPKKCYEIFNEYEKCDPCEISDVKIENAEII